MSKEKQIEEMIGIVKPFVSGLACEEESGSCEFVNCRYCRARDIARAIYIKGYRKQSEGEWVWKMKIEPQAQNRLYCSVCDEECLGKNNYYVKSNFCPNCGAKMKGGAE